MIGPYHKEPKLLIHSPWDSARNEIKIVYGRDNAFYTYNSIKFTKNIFVFLKKWIKLKYLKKWFKMGLMLRRMNYKKINNRNKLMIY